jgi:2,4-diketo-3-deoxy-L-fuconate hydrolase
MRLTNLKGRATLITPGGAIDVEQGSGGRFGPDPQAIFSQWSAFLVWAAAAPVDTAAAFSETDLACSAPRPAEVFGIGPNYKDHAAEAGLPVPACPAVFTKFPTCLTGPFADVILPSPSVDWEVELVVVMGSEAYRAAERQAWEHVAGLAVGQDLSERVVQWGAGGQFSLGKSFPGFGPMGPWLVTPDELASPDDLEISCSVNGEVMQKSRTANMVFSVPRLIAELSAILPLLPGDVIFTGTPAGIGGTRQPTRFLHAGDVVTSHIEAIGTLRNRCVASS